MKMIENETNVAVPLEIVKASDIEPKEVKWLWYPYNPIRQGNFVARRSRRWQKQVYAFTRCLALKGRTSSLC